MAKIEDKENTQEKNINSKIVQKKHNFLKLFIFFLFLCALSGVATTIYIFNKYKEQSATNILQIQQTCSGKIDNLNNRLKNIEAELTLLKNRPQTESGISEKELNQRLATLQNDLQTALNAGKTDLQAANNFIPTKQPQEVLLASGAMIIGNLAENGEPIIYETEVLHILAQGNEPALKYVEDMQKYAVSGISGKQQLIYSFNSIFAELNKTIQPEENNEALSVLADTAWYDKVFDWFKKLFVAKKGSTKPIFSPQKDTVLLLVNEGHLQEALNALKTDDKYTSLNSTALKEWIKQTEDYLAFKHAASGLLMNALANLHLKEFEH